MKTKVYTLLLLLLFGVNSVCATETQMGDSATAAALLEINKIKMSPDVYIYAEVTMKDWMEAYEAAKSLLKDNLTSWLKETQNPDIKGCIVKSDEKFLQIQARRGDLYRAFVYVKKADIVPYSESRQMLNVDLTEKKSETHEVLMTKETKDDKQKEQKNAVANVKEDAQAQTPAKVASVNENPNKTEKTKTEPVKTEPNKETPVKKDPVKAEPVEKPIETVTYSPTQKEKSMLLISKSAEIQSFIKDNEQEGFITKYGKYANRPSDGEYYLFIYNREGEVPACLKFDNGKLMNLKTGKEDSFNNYKNCGAIWFTTK